MMSRLVGHGLLRSSCPQFALGSRTTLPAAVVLALLLLVSAWSAPVFGQTQDQPNIVLIFPDNLGIGEVSSYGGARGVLTPNIDRIADEGMRLTNFNVEYSCTVSRIALLTGRYAPRTGEGYAAGMTLWEETIAEGLKSVGYSTALFGKWHVGGSNWEGRREPTQQGFDEWWGIPGTSNTAQFATFEHYDSTRTPVPYIWTGKAGEPSTRVMPYNLENRRIMDRIAAEKGVEFMERNVEEGKPFFFYYPMTQIHFPTVPHPEFSGATGAGDVADAMADVDHNVGLVLEAIDRLGIAENTLVFWCADNGAEKRRPWRGNAGPFRGYYNSAMEGGIRTPCVIRWTGRIPGGQVSNDVVHQVDLFPTIAAAAGAPEIVPSDRIIDGVNQLPFLEGSQPHSGRESMLAVAREGHIMAVKWRNWKMWYAYTEDFDNPTDDDRMRLFDLGVDPREENDVKDFYPWVVTVMDSIVADYEASLVVHPRVPGGIDDPYTPPARGTGDPVATFRRTDRTDLPERSEAIPYPDFTGTWSTATVSSAPPTGQLRQAPTPTLGSGWGERISIAHSDDLLEVNRVFFVPREIQPTISWRYSLDASASHNRPTIGRDDPPVESRTQWQDDRLVITSYYPAQNPDTRRWERAEVIQTLWLQPARGTPFEPTLVVETTRMGIFGGRTSTNRTVYVKGYR